MEVNKEVEVGQFCLCCSLYITRRHFHTAQRGRGFDLRMVQFVVSTSIFHYYDPFSLALAAVSKVLIFSRTRYCWGAGGTYCRNKIPFWVVDWPRYRIMHRTCSYCFSRNREATRGEMETFSMQLALWAWAGLMVTLYAFLWLTFMEWVKYFCGPKGTQQDRNW